MTNREYRDIIMKLIDDDKTESISLKQFLMNLSVRISDYKSGITSSELVKVFEMSLKKNSFIDTNDLSKHKSPRIIKIKNKYKVFMETLYSQIYDLHIMELEGCFERSYIDSDIQSPRRNKWTNIHVYSYLECSSAWLIDFYSDNGIFSTDWDDLSEMLVMGRLYE